MERTDLFYRKLLDSIRDGVYFVDRERRITFWNKGAERITGYLAEEVVGLRCADTILQHVDRDGACLCTGDCPLAAIIRGDAPDCTAEILLRHREGHRVPVHIRGSVIRDESGEVAGAVEVFSEIALPHAYDSLRELDAGALLDPLTGIGNRRYLEMKVRQALADFRDAGVPFGLIVFDIDRFKETNDTWGHLVGDRVLKMVTETVRMNIRATDAVCRFGGDEFVVVVNHSAGGQIVRIGEKLRKFVEHSFILVEGSPVSVTISLGAVSADDGDDAESIFGRADDLLYEAKRQGRNRLVFCTTPC
ncbi:MAG TPA: sensor domain-containing diguanylate cyclase [Verrucomicrobiae bacterium]|nr:sensor domain-containing diguanylate cyclase [Verrucomicrobiae bacterium]